MGGATFLLTLLVIGGVDLAVGQNCDPPGDVPNSVRTISGNTATYSCTAGYAANGIASQAQISCVNGQWPALPTCIRTGSTGCADPPPLLNGQPQFASTNIGATAIYRCNPGFTMSGPATVVCQSGGQWSNRPTCQPSTGGGGGTGQGCGDPGQVPNAGRVLGGTTVGSTATYNCQAGFTMSGNSVVTCLNTGQWTARPSCSQTGGGGGGGAQGCLDPGNVANGQRELRSTTVGGTVVYRCNTGFRLSGSGTLTCQNTGQWTPARPNCVVSGGGGGPAQGCFDPGFVVNGARVVGETIVGGTVTYTCNTGFTLSGSATITCQATGQWFPNRPTCVVGTGGGGGTGCGAPSAVANAGRSQITGTGTGSTVRYTCNSGYTLQGSATRTCQSNGQWSAAPSCSRSDTNCGDPGFIANAYRAAYSTNMVGSTVRYICYPRFTMQGNGVRTCGANGQWSPSPVCSSSGCGDAAIIPNAQRTSMTGTSTGSTASYSCNTDFMLQGSTSTTRCQDNGQWTPYPICVRQAPTTCGDPGNVANARRESITSTNIAGTAIFRCNTGFSVNGVSNIVRLQCLTTGQWTPNPIPSCTQGTSPTGCGNPPTVVNGMRTFTSTSTGATATYTCNTGFNLQGTATVTCQSNRQWTTVPTCSSTPTGLCGAAPDIPNAQLQSTVGGIATYRCNPGFTTLVGNQASQLGFRICQSNRQWSTAPVCSQTGTQTCGDPGQVANAQRIGSQTTFAINAIVTYSCNPGFQTTIAGQPSSVGIRTCMAGGVWSAAPVCIGCANPPTVAQSTNVQRTTSSVRTVTYTCNARYTLQGAATLRCQNGQWTPAAPTCVISGCGTAPTIPNANAPTVQSTNIGGTASYTCATGFTLQGSDPITCQANGLWSTRPTCVQRQQGQCADPDAVANGRRTVIGIQATYTCNPGYTLAGSSARICQGGTWTPAAPTCSLTGCGPPSVVDNATPSPVNAQTTFGSAVTYTCNAGFILRGAGTIVCRNTGQWTDSPTCARNCPARPTVAQSTSTEQTAILPRRATYTCNAGFTLQGQATITCQDNGQWTTPPTCTRTGCGNPPTVTNAAAPTVTSTNIGGTASYTCNAGFTLTGTATITCQSSGQWTTAPTCNQVATACPAIPQVQNAVPSGTLTTIGASVTYTCTAGFTILGNPVITCQTNGQWSTQPSCRQTTQPTGCQNLPTVTNAQSPQLLGTNPLRVQFTCNPGFTLNGQATVTCTNNVWSATPTCTAAPTGCTTITTIPNVANSPNPTIVTINPLTVRFTCNPGFRLNGQATVTCQNNAWGATPTCTPGVAP